MDEVFPDKAQRQKRKRQHIPGRENSMCKALGSRDPGRRGHVQGHLGNWTQGYWVLGLWIPTCPVLAPPIPPGHPLYLQVPREHSVSHLKEPEAGLHLLPSFLCKEAALSLTWHLLLLSHIWASMLTAWESLPCCRHPGVRCPQLGSSSPFSLVNYLFKLGTGGEVWPPGERTEDVFTL